MDYRISGIDQNCSRKRENDEKVQLMIFHDFCFLAVFCFFSYPPPVLRRSTGRGFQVEV